jgi:hypothetical protein
MCTCLATQRSWKVWRLYTWLLGLPSCVASMDGVHFAWDKCHAPSVPAYKRKENYPIVVYNVVTCDHARRVMPLHGPFPGARSDKNIARTDPTVRAVRYDDSVYLWFSYPMYDHMGASFSMPGITPAPSMCYGVLVRIVLTCMLLAQCMYYLCVYRCMDAL